MMNFGMRSTFQSLLFPYSFGGCFPSLKSVYRFVMFTEAQSPP
jgi:hypothetical protein